MHRSKFKALSPVTVTGDSGHADSRKNARAAINKQSNIGDYNEIEISKLCFVDVDN
jgi:hypothetical protein